MNGGIPGGLNGGIPGGLNGGIPGGLNGGIPGGLQPTHLVQQNSEEISETLLTANGLPGEIYDFTLPSTNSLQF